MTFPLDPAILEAPMLLALFFVLAFFLGVSASCAAWGPRARRDAKEIAYLRRRLATSDDCGRAETVRRLRERAAEWAQCGHLHTRQLLALADKLERGESVG